LSVRETSTESLFQRRISGNYACEMYFFGVIAGKL